MKDERIKLPTDKEVNKFNSLLVRAKLADKDTEFLAQLLSVYKLGVRYITADFSGSGDSGDLCDFNMYSGVKNGEHINVDDGVNVEEIRDKMFEMFESNVECDWVNNDGGGGMLSITLPSLAVNVTSYYNETVSHDMPDIKLTLNPLK
jgi:hypothetical protein